MRRMREPRSPTQAPTAEPWWRCSSLLATATFVRTPGRRAMRSMRMRPSATSRISEAKIACTNRLSVCESVICAPSDWNATPMITPR